MHVYPTIRYVAIEGSQCVQLVALSQLIAGVLSVCFVRVCVCVCVWCMCMCVCVCVASVLQVLCVNACEYIGNCSGLVVSLYSVCADDSIENV